jgi:hypothetical protein
MVGAATTAGLSISTIQVIEAMAIEPLSVCVIRDGKICYVLPEELTPAERKEVEERRTSAEARKRFGKEIASLSRAERKLWRQARAVIARNSKELKKRTEEE